MYSAQCVIHQNIEVGEMAIFSYIMIKLLAVLCFIALTQCDIATEESEDIDEHLNKLSQDGPVLIEALKNYYIDNPPPKNAPYRFDQPKNTKLVYVSNGCFVHSFENLFDDVLSSMSKIGGGVLYQYLQSVQSYIAPPITVVFLLGILWKRVNSKAAIVTLFTGLVVIVLRIVAEIYQAELSGFLHTFATINFAHMAIFMFLFSLVVCISVSLATDPPNYANIAGLAFGTLTKEDRAMNSNSISNIDVILSAVLIVVVVAILIYFTG